MIINSSGCPKNTAFSGLLSTEQPVEVWSCYVMLTKYQRREPALFYQWQNIVAFSLCLESNVVYKEMESVVNLEIAADQSESIWLQFACCMDEDASF